MLVDLAGSERLSFLESNPNSIMQKETIGINKSLMSLRKVINSLALQSNPKTAHKISYIPYRESKLTQLLKQSLGGNSYCLMIACLSPCDESYEENLSTLQYATKTGLIKNKPL